MSGILHFSLQIIAVLKRFLQCRRQLLRSVVGIRARGLEFADLLHEGFVLSKQSLMLDALRLQLLLPSGVDGDLFLGAPIAPQYPAGNHTDEGRQRQQPYVDDRDFRHGYRHWQSTSGGQSDPVHLADNIANLIHGPVDLSLADCQWWRKSYHGFVRLLAQHPALH